MKGKLFLIKANTGTNEIPEWTSILGQRGGSLELGADTTDTTTKDSNGWTESEITYNNWSLAADGLLEDGDPAISKLQSEYIAQNKVLVQTIMPNGDIYEGQAIISGLSYEGPHDDEVSYSIELTGTGALTSTPAA